MSRSQVAHLTCNVDSVPAPSQKSKQESWTHSSWVKPSSAAILSCLLFPNLVAAEPLHVEATFSHGAQHPTTVPVPPSLSLRKQVFYGPLVGVPGPGKGYQPTDGNGFSIHNGKGVYNFILTTG